MRKVSTCKTPAEDLGLLVDTSDAFQASTLTQNGKAIESASNGSQEFLEVLPKLSSALAMPPQGDAEVGFRMPNFLATKAINLLFTKS